MAKVQKYKARRDEHLGEERAMRKRFYDGDYAGAAGRKAEEARDAEMISEDRSAMANLPQDVVMKPWPKAGYPARSSYNDNISGINEQIDEDDSKASGQKGFKY